MKTRIVVHIALNAKGERTCYLMCVAGRFIPFSDNSELQKGAKRQTSFWIYGGFYRIARKTSPFRARMNSATAKPF